MKKPILVSISPNTEKDDIALAWRTLLMPWKWKDQKETRRLEEEFENIFGEEFKAFAINSGRSAETLILEALGVKKGDSVAIQAFTCVAVPNSILKVGATPVYVDIGDDYNMDPRDLEKKITKKTAAIIIQHTFGIPANIEEIGKIANKKNIPLIEDCAHALGGTYKGELLGTHGRAAFFSFGRDKIISSVFGGMVLSSDKKLAKKIENLRSKTSEPRASWIVQQLLHPILLQLIIPLYFWGPGKLMLFLLQKINILSKAVYKEERVGKMPTEIFPTKMPGGLAALARNQLNKLKRFNGHRQEIVNQYKKSFPEVRVQSKVSSWLRFPIEVKDPKGLMRFAKGKQILLGDWYRQPVTPAKELSLVGYKMGSCPRAEELGAKVINLPTHPRMTMAGVSRVIKVIKEWQSIEATR